MAERWLAAAPFHMFLTRIEDSKATHNEKLSITFPGNYIVIASLILSTFQLTTVESSSTGQCSVAELEIFGLGRKFNCGPRS